MCVVIKGGRGGGVVVVAVKGGDMAGGEAVMVAIVTRREGFGQSPKTTDQEGELLRKVETGMLLFLL